MSHREDDPARREIGRPPEAVALPADLTAFLRGQEFAALWHAADIGSLLVLKAPEPDLETLGGPVLIGLVHELWRHPAAPVVRSLVTLHDRPDSALRLETFTNVADPAQRSTFAALGAQKRLHILCYDDDLRHRLTKRLPNTTGPQIPGIVAEADRLLAAIPPDRVDFAAAKAAIMEVTGL